MGFPLLCFCALLQLQEFFEVEMVAVRGDVDGATLAGGQDCGAV